MARDKIVTAGAAIWGTATAAAIPLVIVPVIGPALAGGAAVGGAVVGGLVSAVGALLPDAEKVPEDGGDAREIKEGRQEEQKEDKREGQDRLTLSIKEEDKRLQLLPFIDLRELFQLGNHQRDFFLDRLFPGDIRTNLQTLDLFEAVDVHRSHGSDFRLKRELFRELIRKRELNPDLPLDDALDLRPRYQDLRGKIKGIDNGLQGLFENIVRL